MISERTAAAAWPESAVLRELVRERDDRAWGAVYRSGRPYTAARLLLSLANVSQRDPMEVAADEPIGISFFSNERAALELHAAAGAPMRIIHFDGPRLGFIMRKRGIRWVRRALSEGARALRRGASAANDRSLAVPLLGWLLYRHALESDRWRAPNGLAITNIISPLSLGVLFALARKGARVTYVEHAMTPRNMMRPLPINEVYFSSPHTLELWRALLPETGATLRQRFTDIVPKAERYALSENPRILICVNDLDGLASIAAMVKASRESSSAVAVRMHEADPRRAEVAQLTRATGARLSFAGESAIAADLAVSDIVICGNTNALLDALRARKRLVYYWDGDPAMFDYYGSVAYYGVESARSPDELKKRLTDAMAR